MGLPVTIQNDRGKRRGARVDEDGELLVTATPFPPKDIIQHMRPFTEFFRNSAGDFSMGEANGSVTPVEFTIDANDSDKYICEISFELGYGGIGYLYRFGDDNALTNGVRFYYTSAEGETDFANVVKTNSDLLRLRRDPFNSEWQARNFDDVNDYGFQGTIDLKEFMPPYGIKLDEGSNQKMVISIRDDLTGPIDIFNFFARGFERTG